MWALIQGHPSLSSSICPASYRGNGERWGSQGFVLWKSMSVGQPYQRFRTAGERDQQQGEAPHSEPTLVSLQSEALYHFLVAFVFTVLP